MAHGITAIGGTKARPSFPASRLGPMVITSLRNINLQGQRQPKLSGSKPVEKTVVKVTSKENVGFGQQMLRKVSKPSSAATVKVVTSAERIPQRSQLRHVSKSRKIPVVIMRNWRAGSRAHFRPRPAPKTVVKVTSQEAVGFGQHMLKKAAPKTIVKFTTNTDKFTKRRHLRHVATPRRKIYPVNILRDWRNEQKVRRRIPASKKTIVRVTSSQDIRLVRNRLRHVTRRPKSTVIVPGTIQFRSPLRHITAPKRKVYPVNILRDWKNESKVRRKIPSTKKTIVRGTRSQNIRLGRRKLRHVTQRSQSKVKVTSPTRFRPRLRHISVPKRKIYPVNIFRDWKSESKVKRRPVKRTSQIRITAIDHGMGQGRRASKKFSSILPYVTYRAPPTRMAVKPASHHGPEVAIASYHKRK
ncbi:hypothetical protein CHUAL_008034 [Chamberlinius hualienensis]